MREPILLGWDNVCKGRSGVWLPRIAWSMVIGNIYNKNGMSYGVTGKHDGCRKEVPLRRFESGYGNNVRSWTIFLFSVEIIIFYYLPAVKVRRFLFLQYNLIN